MKRISIFFSVIPALFLIPTAFGELRPLCGRSHAYAVELLSKEVRYQAAFELENGGSWVGPAQGQALVESGDYVELRAPGITGDPDRLVYVPAMHLIPGNAPGRFKTRLCWWHSRFQRAAVYLMDFAPNRPKPDSAAARKLFATISELKPVTVPGYRSLAEFSADFPDALYSVLADWELRTTLLAPGNAIGGYLTKVLTSETEKKRLFTESAWNIVDDVTAIPRPVFLFEEGPGMIHAVLALSARAQDPTNSTILLRVVDSEQPGGSYERAFLANGEFSPRHGEYGFHPGFDSDFTRIQEGCARSAANFIVSH